MNCSSNCRKCTYKFKKERLFRGKRLDNGEWFYGFEFWSSWIGDGGYIVLSDHNEMNRVDPETVGEFTGAYTVDGTRIFEDDIIDIPGWVVTYSTGMNCCYGMHVGWYIQRDNWESWAELQNTDKFVIIGNIHDNPELMRR